MLICNITTTVLILGFASPGLAQWQYSVVDTLQSDLENLSIDLGPGGIPHILYYDFQEAIVTHAHLSDTGWTRDTVGFSNNYYGFCIDSLDQVHVVFTAPTYKEAGALGAHSRY